MDLQSLVVEEDPNTFETQINVPRENLSMVENSQTNKWILEKHNMWTKITLNSFYEECAAGTVTCAQLTKWVYDVGDLTFSLLNENTKYLPVAI